MKKHYNRRNFLKLSALSASPILLGNPFNHISLKQEIESSSEKYLLSFVGDSVSKEPEDYLKYLLEINKTMGIQKDAYGFGGSVLELEKKFAKLTDKEAAIYMPSGTMANQLAIAYLSEEKTKVFVQDLSHIFRDEADSAQSVFGKRLIPLAQDKAYFTLEELKSTIENLPNKEVFKSGIGAVAIENPVRRAMGEAVPIEEIKKIREYCLQEGIKMHLDGARLFLASAWTGYSIQDYSQYFDTVYISLYKYLGSSAGAILCGDKKLIEDMKHLIKVHGGNMYQNWQNTAPALYALSSIDNTLTQVKSKAEELKNSLNKLENIKVTHHQNGTNIYKIKLSHDIDPKAFSAYLVNRRNIKIFPFNEDHESILMMNESLLTVSNDKIIAAFIASIEQAKM